MGLTKRENKSLKNQKMEKKRESEKKKKKKKTQSGLELISA